LSPPTAFPFRELGFPEIRKLGGPSEITAADTAFRSDDTVRKPIVPPWDPFAGLELAAPLLLVALGLYFLTKD
jgi:hypothetical protein